ncbi:MAG: NBR1-Ig-like domain-containing protein [Anaerolineaceae bacterium]|nr:NBR1-Ig-like domain-containing protein [Anaerolineaceae bacterium]
MKERLTVILCIVLLLTVVLGACKADVPEPTETPTTHPPEALAVDTPEPTVESTPDDYPGWEQYTNEIYGFSFRYPSTWMVEDISYENPVGGTVNMVQLSQDTLTLFIEYGFSYELIGSGGTGIGAGEIQSLGEATFFDQTVATSALVYQGKTKTIFFNAPGRIIPVSDLVYVLSLQDTAQVPYEELEIPADVLDEVAQILGSFEEGPRTIEPQDPLPGWETHTITDYGIVFRYPPKWEMQEISYQEVDGSTIRAVDLRSAGGIVLHMAYHFTEEYILQSEGIGIGELHYEGTIPFLGREIEKFTLIHEGVDKSVTYGEDIEAGVLTFNIRLQYSGDYDSYADVEVPDEVQLQAEQILNTVQLMQALATPQPPQILSEGSDIFLAFDGCFDLDEGMETPQGGPDCDFNIRQPASGDELTIQFLPQSPAAFGFGGVFPDEPTLAQCAESEMLSSAEETIAPLASHHICYQTNLGHFGYLIFGAVTSDGITFDWRTFKAAGPFVEPADGRNAGIFLQDVTIPDGTVFEPGETFTKTWKLMNTGEATWTIDYAIRFKEGDRLDGPYEVRLPKEVLPGGQVNVSVDFTAPEKPGEYRSDWYLRDMNGNTFGLEDEDYPTFWVTIIVAEKGQATPTEGPTGSQDSPITEITLQVDPVDYKGVCPVTLLVSGAIYSVGANSFVYELEAGSEQAQFQFYLPSAQTATFGDNGVNQRALSYSLSIQNSVVGWVRMFVSSPGVYRSSKVFFKINCD